ncbi:MAG: GntR family transcriptional regulator [Solirubrobacteraceae bacterium]
MAERLRALIMEGVYQPNDRLPHPQIMRMLNVGRTPAREALRRLRSRASCRQAEPGASVAPMQPESLEQAHVLGLLIEPPLLEASLALIRRNTLKQLRELLRRMEATFRRTGGCRPCSQGISRCAALGLHKPASSTMWVTHPRLRRPSPAAHPSGDCRSRGLRQPRGRDLGGDRRRDGRRVRQALDFHIVEAALSVAGREVRSLTRSARSRRAIHRDAARRS